MLYLGTSGSSGTSVSVSGSSGSIVKFTSATTIGIAASANDTPAGLKLNICTEEPDLPWMLVLDTDGTIYKQALIGSGSSGTSGSAGTNGTSGSSGKNGTSGSSGVSGTVLSGGTDTYFTKWTGANSVSVGFVTDDGTSINILRQIYLSGVVSEAILALAPASGVVTLNLNSASVFLINLTTNINSFTLTNVSAARASSFTIILVCASAARTVNFLFNSSAVRWPSATAPTITTGLNQYDVFSFVLEDNTSETWLGFIGGQNF